MKVIGLIASILTGFHSRNPNTDEPLDDSVFSDSIYDDSNSSTSLSDTAVNLTLDTVILRQPIHQDHIPGYTKLDLPQTTTINNSARIIAIRNNKHITEEELKEDLGRFFELHKVNEEYFSRLDPLELEARLRLIEALMKSFSSTHIPNNTLEEYEGYKKFTLSPFREVIEKFIKTAKDKSIDNFTVRGNIAEYLEHRSNQDDINSALNFIEDLATLSGIYHVKGIGELIKAALKHEISHSDNTNNAHGFYKHAKAALNLAQSKPHGLKVLEVAAEEIEQNGTTYRVPWYAGDIDILAREGNKDLFIEVKTSAHAAISNVRQLKCLLEFSKRQNATPVLMIGNIRHQIELAKNQIGLEPDQLVIYAKENIISLGRIIEEHSDTLQVWDRRGENVTNTIRDLYKSLAMKTLLRTYQHV
ncbi:MAG: hypothetical protein HYR97_02650 [Candidatus Melainabacteria bacterium]|nr:hypothetical protein [Candidatus Melainabacteria bacterium]MBI3309609.1 hypothetical protein [Candidatus Melainabacteria bacterium]